MRESSENVNKNLTGLIREKLASEFRENEDLYDEIDMEKISTDDWSIVRYILHCKQDCDTAFEMLKKSLQWRKSFEVNKLQATHFPREFYESGSFFPFTEDKNGNVVIYLRGKFHRKLSDWTQLFKKFFVFVIDSVDKKKGGKHYTVFWDCEGAGIANVDLEMLTFMTSVITNYFPYGIEYIMIHELPWVLTAIYNLAKSWVPEHYQRLVRFVTRTQINEWITVENLPQYLNGTSEVDCRQVPQGVSTAKQIEEKYHLNRGAASQLEQHINKYCID
ncbi:motile sperm domain-containing protein 2-like protein [Leptotrombidium deliense]|uniref:Motile sperm domain-containing protein 2-like protein n=1 Tax=Leptotrombidium deliense TaxID=299467 RepID=A0A443S3Z7_9ACAR|nr:motile sperm domain-containing protein 2-like protein [Leptotrombidium deliense]